MHSFAKKKCHAFKFVLDEIQTRGLFGCLLCIIGIVGAEEISGVLIIFDDWIRLFDDYQTGKCRYRKYK